MSVKTKILLVDKQEIYTQAMAELLTEAGYNVDFCSDADSTYRKIRTSVRPFDLLIIDLDALQETDGFHFLKALAREGLLKELKVIITTSSLMDQRLSQGEDELNICFYFNKARIIEEFFLIVADIIPPGGRDLRYCRRIPVKILVNYEAGGNKAFHYATNLSHSGIFIQNDKPDPVGTIAQITFNLPGTAAPLSATAKIMRIVRYEAPVSSLRTQNFPPGVGMAFTQISEEHKAILQAFLDKEELRIFGANRK